jgi:hypothetical protein
VCVRVVNTKLAEARKVLMQGDERFCEDNFGLIVSDYYEVQGLPFGAARRRLLRLSSKVRPKQ